MSESSLAFVFPGQGSQSLGMLAALAGEHPVVVETFREASTVLGYDLWAVTQDGPEAELNRTDRTQPAMLAAGIAVWRVWQNVHTARPGVVAGHSLGEYTALVCAGAIGFRDAVRIVADRARYMQEAVPEGQGAMAAILGLTDDEVRSVCNAASQGDVVEAVNFNAPGQVVVAGTAAAVSRAVEQARAAGAKRAITLPVSAPSHCSLMKPASQRLAARLGDVLIQKPTIPVLHNVDAAPCEDPSGIRDRLVRQLYSPVLWVKTIESMRDRGVRRIVECGPGRVLAGLAKRIDRAIASVPVYDPVSVNKALEG